MTDDWVKQLKNAGFPKLGPGEPVFVRDDRVADDSHPRLSDLIAACPKECAAATFVLGSSQGGRRWTATYFDFRNNKMAEDDNLCQSGDTPEEAVAKLWLAWRTKSREVP